jgi:hypothetical protein
MKQTPVRGPPDWNPFGNFGVFNKDEISRASEMVSEGRVGAPMTRETGSKEEPNTQRRRESSHSDQGKTHKPKVVVVVL